MKSRLLLPAPDQLDPAQSAIYQSILSTRGNVEGPFLAWLLAPGLADPAQRLGAFCRYGTSLALVESELLILLVAAGFDCVGEQQIHEPIAIGAGLSEAAVDAIRTGATPELATPRQRMLLRMATALIRTNRIPESVYGEATAEFGQTGVVEIVGVIGYYALVAMTLNAFDMRKT